MAYCKLDDKGRITIPKEFRGRLREGGVARWDESTGSLRIDPMAKKKAYVEIDVICEPEDLLRAAWAAKVAIVPVGEANGNAVLGCYGEYEALRGFCEYVGYDPDDLDYSF